MCNRARLNYEPETLHTHSGATSLMARPNRNPIELTPRRKAPSIWIQDGARAIDQMAWDLLGGQAAWPMTNVRNFVLPEWRRLAERPEQRCIITVRGPLLPTRRATPAAPTERLR